jgi:hypothetical protein
MAPRRTRFVIAALMLLALVSSGCNSLDLSGLGAATPGPDAAATEVLPPLQMGSGDLAVRLLAPHDGEIFEAADILVIGEARPGIVLSVNDSLAVADAQGKFSIPIHLEEGTNLLEIIASNEGGDQISATLVVSYLPPS